MAWALPVAVTLVALLVVLKAFDIVPHNGGDNAGYISLAYSLLKHHAYLELFDPSRLPHTKYPPVFPAVLAGLMAVGVRGWIGLKSAAAVPTIVVVFLTHLWARRRVGSLAASGVSLIVAFSYGFVYYSHWILSDPLFVAITLLSLWALDHATDPDARGRGGGGDGATGEGRTPGPGLGWLIVGVAAALVAYFTRSAGLPLLVAVLAWLAVRRRWRAFVVSAVALGVPVMLWWLRARAVAGEGYVSEFWLKDPYTPDLGRVGLGGLLGRVGANLVGYVGTHLPMGIVGARGGVVPLVGIALVALALVGWLLALRRRIGPSELFLPLYAGLILLWPVVWSGDRFALPLVPVMLGYAALTIRWIGRRWGKVVGSAMATLALSAAVLPAVVAWAQLTREASIYAATEREHGAFTSYGPRVATFVEAARWSGANLPEGAAVLSRKPRIFYVMSGVPGRTFPFTDVPGALLALADSLDARYVLVDQWDVRASAFVANSVRNDPGAYCVVRDFRGTDAEAQMLGILPPERRAPSPQSSPGEGVYLQPCPASYVRGDGNAPYSASSGEIPLLRGLDP